MTIEEQTVLAKIYACIIASIEADEAMEFTNIEALAILSRYRQQVRNETIEECAKFVRQFAGEPSAIEDLIRSLKTQEEPDGK